MNQIQDRLKNVANASDFFRALSYFRPKAQSMNNLDYVNIEALSGHFSEQFNLYVNDNRSLYENSIACRNDVILDRDFT
jgi:hypothetical protein